MIGTKSGDSIFYHTYKDCHKPELEPVDCIVWTILQPTNLALRFVWSFLFCFRLLFYLEKNFGTIIGPFRVNKKGWAGLIAYLNQNKLILSCSISCN